METNRTVLIVDDEPDLLSIFDRVLSYAGFSVFTAEGGWKALEILECHPEISVVVTDVVMPAMDGVELTRRVLEKRGNQTQIILMTGDTRQRLPLDGGFEACPILRKPFDVNALVKLVASLTGVETLPR